MYIYIYIYTYIYTYIYIVQDLGPTCVPIWLHDVSDFQEFLSAHFPEAHVDVFLADCKRVAAEVCMFNSSIAGCRNTRINIISEHWSRTEQLFKLRFQSHGVRMFRKPNFRTIYKFKQPDAHDTSQHRIGAYAG